MELERGGILDDVLPEDYLELYGGVIVKGLNGLVEALEGMSDEDFKLHVYGDQNDFAEWIMEAYWDDKLTGKILGIQNRKKMIKFLRGVLKKAESDRSLKIGKMGGKRDVLKEIGQLE